MDQNQQNGSNISEGIGSVRKDSESFRTVPNDSESFRSVPNLSERTESHTLTVREVARLFSEAGVARTERSIINWCQPNKLGVARLDAYFDPNDRRYYITSQSIESAIAEEQVKAEKGRESSVSFGSVPKQSEPSPKGNRAGMGNEVERVDELEREVFDLKITNRGKDYFIEQIQKEREGFITQLLDATRKVGELETRLLQIEGPTQDSTRIKSAEL